MHEQAGQVLPSGEADGDVEEARRAGRFRPSVGDDPEPKRGRGGTLRQKGKDVVPGLDAEAEAVPVKRPGLRFIPDDELHPGNAGRIPGNRLFHPHDKSDGVMK
jgi:hypothetical protein